VLNAAGKGRAFASGSIGSLGLTFVGVIFEAFVLQGSLFLVLGVVFSFHGGVACCDGTIRRVGPDLSEAGRARGLHAWAAIEVSVVGSMHLASLGELTSTVWIGGEIRLPFRKRQRVVPGLAWKLVFRMMAH
jgi:hypothetical protein